ncbi:MAG: hypothetical protein NT154_14125 [Verrucomicrobia bacterium]|nr:hypothetical protein [Verrucomicrobiota bacterium]
MKNALDYFGGSKLAYETVAQRIQEARRNSGIAPEELGRLASMSTPTLVDDLENRRTKPNDLAASEILAVSAQIGLSVEVLLPLRHGLTQEDETQWNKERQAADAHPVVAVNGTPPAELPLSHTIELFLRFRALDELFSRPAKRLTPIPA